MFFIKIYLGNSYIQQFSTGVNVGWFNYYGLAILILLMIPNIIASIKNKDIYQNKFNNKILEYAEQAGRFGSFTFLIFNIPILYFNFWFIGALQIYLIGNGLLLVIYLVTWMLKCKNNLSKVLLLSIAPSLIFIFSGIMVLNIPLIIFAVLFAITHITISVKNALL